MRDKEWRERVLQSFGKHDERTAWRLYAAHALQSVIGAPPFTREPRPLAEVAAEFADEMLNRERERFGSFEPPVTPSSRPPA